MFVRQNRGSELNVFFRSCKEAAPPKRRKRGKRTCFDVCRWCFLYCFCVFVCVFVHYFRSCFYSLVFSVTMSSFVFQQSFLFEKMCSITCQNRMFRLEGRPQFSSLPFPPSRTSCAAEGQSARQTKRMEKKTRKEKENSAQADPV